MSVNASFGGSNFTPPTHAFDHDTLQDVALACVEGIVSALASSDTRRARHIAERLAAVLSASPLSLPSALECTCHRTMGCAHRRFGDHFQAAECFKAALAQPGGEDSFQRVNTLMLLSNSLSALQRLDLALDSASEAQSLLQKILFEQPHLMVLNSACDNASAPVQMVRLVVAVHFRVGVLKQQLGNHAGARDALHAIEVSRMLLGRFSVGQQMFRIVREDGTLIPVVEQVSMRSLSDNLNITGNLNATASTSASAAPEPFSAAAQPHPPLAASSIYSSASSGLSSLMPKLHVPEPDLTDPTDSLRDVTQALGAQGSMRGQLAAKSVLDGTRDMWQGEFAPGRGRLQLPDVEVEVDAGDKWTLFKNSKQHISATGMYAAWQPQGSHAAKSPKQRLNFARPSQEWSSQPRLNIAPADSVFVPRSSRTAAARVPGSYANSPNARRVTNGSFRPSWFDDNVAIPDMQAVAVDFLGRDGGSSVAAVASVRLADPDTVLNATAAFSHHRDVAREEGFERSVAPLWSEHQASPIVDMLHQYLQQQSERVNALRIHVADITAPANYSLLDDRRLSTSPRLENDSSPQPKHSDARQHVSHQSAAPTTQNDDVTGFLLSRNVAEPSGVKESGYDDRMIDFTVEDFLCDCASMTSAMETELRRELELIAGKPETELQRELDRITSRVAKVENA